jgi:hypothetical protein
MDLFAIPYAALVLIEPTIVSREDFKGRIEKMVMGFSAATKTRRDKWPSREVAHQWMKARYPWRVWDPRMLQALIVLHPLLEIAQSSDHFSPLGSRTHRNVEWRDNA